MLGVTADAPRPEIDAAYRRAARALHPDLDGAEPAAFIRATEARQVLIDLPRAEPVPLVVAHRGRRPLSWPVLVTWIALLVFAVAVSIGGSDLPLGPIDPILRWASLAVGAIGFGVTGRRGFLVLTVIAIAATAVLTIVFTSIGALLGMFLLAAPLYGLLVMGRSRRVPSKA